MLRVSESVLGSLGWLGMALEGLSRQVPCLGQPASSSTAVPLCHALLNHGLRQAGLQNGAVVSKLWGFNAGHFLGAGTVAGLHVPWAARVGWGSSSVALVLRSTFCIDLCPQAA